MEERPKRTLCQPIHFTKETCIPNSKPCKIPTKDNSLYEIEVKEVDRDRNLVRIHFIRIHYKQ